MPQSKSITRPGRRSPFVLYLQQLLEQTGIDLTELGRRTQLTRVTVSRHVNGHAFPHYANRKRYATAFGMKIDEFESGWRRPAIAAAMTTRHKPSPQTSATASSRIKPAGGLSAIDKMFEMPVGMPLPGSVAESVMGSIAGRSRGKMPGRTQAGSRPAEAIPRHGRVFGRDVKAAGQKDQVEATGSALDDASTGIPVLGEVAASGFVESLVYDESEPERLPITYPGLQRVYALRIRGDSMTPVYQPGEILILQDIPPAEIVDSEDAVVQCDGSFDGQSTFKRILVMGDDRLRLMPLNPRYESLECDWQAVARVGRVLGKYTPVSQIRGSA